MRTVTFDFEGSETLTEKEIWPDGSAPENWTTADVVVLLKRGWLEEWNMDGCITVTISDEATRCETRVL